MALASAAATSSFKLITYLLRAASADGVIEAADVALMAEDLAKIEEALAVGYKARRVSDQNIIFTLLMLGVTNGLADGTGAAACA